MFIASSLLASVLVAGGPAPAGADAVRCDVRMLEMKGISWRGEMHPRLVSVARKGTVTIWSGGPDVTDELIRRAATVTKAPRVTHPAGGPIHLDSMIVRGLVGDMKRCADGPYNQSKLIAYAPEVDQHREGFEVHMSGEPTAEGVLLRLNLNDSRIAAVRTYSITEKTVGDEAKGAKPVTLSAQVQVPEVVRSEVEGEWLVPRGGVLVVSMGTFTLADDQGKAEVRERVAVIEAEAVAGLDHAEGDVIRATFAPARNAHAHAHPVAMAPVRVATSTAAVNPPVAPPVPIGPSLLLPMASPTVAPAPVAAPTRKLTLSAFALPGFPLPILAYGVAVERLAPRAPMPMPAPPARALPTPVAADGSIVALPPLPEDLAVEAIEDSAETRPAPQDRPASREKAPGMLVKAAPAARFVVEDVVLYPAPRPAPEEAAVCGDIALGVARDGRTRDRELTLDDTIALALENAETTCVANNSGARREVEVRPVDPDARAGGFREECAAMVRSVEQQYWALQLAAADAATREKVVELCEQVLRREESRQAHGRGDSASVAEVREHLDRLRLDAVEASVTLSYAERQLRDIAGLATEDTRHLLAVSPARETQVQFLMRDCVAEKLGSLRPEDAGDSPAATRDLAGLRKMLREVDASYRGFQSARRLKDSAHRRLVTSAQAYELGGLPIDRYLDSLGRWADAVAKEAEYRAEYNTAIACVEEWKGTLLASHGVTIAAPARVDAEAASKSREIAPDDQVEQAAYQAAYFAKAGAPYARQWAAGMTEWAKAIVSAARAGFDLDGEAVGIKSCEEGADRVGISILDPAGMNLYSGDLGIDALRDEPVTLRLPTSNGGVVEITAKMVKKPAAPK